MNLDTVPDLTMRGLDDPHGLTTTRPPTVGQLAARLHALAAVPGDWWHLVAFDPAGPARVDLAAPDGLRLWVATRPAGHRDDELCDVTLLIAGELSVDGRPLRTNRLRVHGTGHLPTFHNPGHSYAVTLHTDLLIS